MRRSNIQPSQHHNQKAFSDEKKTKEESSTNNLREHQERKPAATSSSSSSHGAEKKESPDTKKLERKTTEDINASADAFIKNFRQQLLIQRLQSIENYEQMLARGL